MRSANRPVQIAIMCIFTLVLGTVLVAGSDDRASSEARQPTVVIHIASGPDQILAVERAYEMARGAMLEGRRVVIFFSQAGTQVAVRRYPPELRIDQAPPQWQQLKKLVELGARPVVCGESAHLFGIRDAEFFPDAEITNNDRAIFRISGVNATVWTF